MLTVIGYLMALVIALWAIGVTVLMLVSGWRALREELMPGFRSAPPGPRSLGLVLLGVALPVLLIAGFTAYLAIWIVGTLIIGS